MAAKIDPASSVQRIVVQCPCGKRLVTMPQHAGKRTKCPGCGQKLTIPVGLSSEHASDSAQQPTEPSGGISKRTLVAVWSLVAVFAVGCILFVVWWSHSIRQAKIAAANGRISIATAAANEWTANRTPTGDGTAIEKQLADALDDTDATDKASGAAALDQLRRRREQFAEQHRNQQAQRQAAAKFDEAKSRIDTNEIKEAITLLEGYIADPAALERGSAQKLLDETNLAMSDARAIDALVELDDSIFDRVVAGAAIPDRKVSHPTLVALRQETVRRNLKDATERRRQMKVAEQERLKAEQEAQAQASDIDAVKAAITSQALYPRTITFAPIEEWTIRPINAETIYEGWVEQEDGLRNDFQVVLRKGEIPERQFGPAFGYQKEEAKPIPANKVWIRIRIDGADILREMPSSRELYVDHRKYDDLSENWRLERPRGDGMFYNYSTRKIEH